MGTCAQCVLFGFPRDMIPHTNPTAAALAPLKSKQNVQLWGGGVGAGEKVVVVWNKFPASCWPLLVQPQELLLGGLHSVQVGPVGRVMRMVLGSAQCSLQWQWKLLVVD